MVENIFINKVLQGQVVASWDWTILYVKRGKQFLQWQQKIKLICEVSSRIHVLCKNSYIIKMRVWEWNWCTNFEHWWQKWCCFNVSPSSESSMTIPFNSWSMWKPWAGSLTRDTSLAFVISCFADSFFRKLIQYDRGYWQKFHWLYLWKKVDWKLDQ